MAYALFVRQQPLTDTVSSFWFKPEQPLDQIAGQFLELSLPHTPADSRGDRRWFTISSRPGLPEFSITTRIRRQGSTFKQALAGQLKPGDRLHISDPLGDFVLPHNTATPIIAVAAGIGITPFMSCISAAAHRGNQRPLQLVHAIRTSQEHTNRFINPNDSAAIGAQITTILEQPDPDWTGATGRLNAERILDAGKDQPDTLYYLSGPEPLVLDLAADLQKAGIDKQHIISDAFLGYR